MTEERIATYTMLPATTQQIEESVATAQKLLTILDKWTLDTPEEEKKAASLLTSAHGKWKELDALRKKVVSPAVQAQRTVNDHFRPALQAWDQVKNRAKQLLAQAVKAREAVNQANLEAVAAGNSTALAKIKPVEAPAGVSYRDEVQINIIDFDLIPREYLAVDWSALKILAREGKPAPPGVEFVRATKVVPTGR